MKQNCESCKFYDENSKCRRFPQSVEQNPNHVCGEFSPKDKLELDCGNCKNLFNTECIAGNERAMDLFGICHLHKLELNF